MQDVARKILDDNGYKSRKFIALIAYWVMVSAALAAAVEFPVVKDLFVSYWTGMSTALGMFFGVQWGHSYLASKVPGTAAVAEVEANAAADAEAAAPAGSAKVPDDD